MIRIVLIIALLVGLALSINAILSDTDPRRLKAAGWGLLSGGLIVGGLWMIVAGG